MGLWMFYENPLWAFVPFVALAFSALLLLVVTRKNERVRGWRLPWFVGWPVALGAAGLGLWLLIGFINFRKLFDRGWGGPWNRQLAEVLSDIGPWRIGSAVVGAGLIVLVWGVYAGFIRAKRFSRRVCPRCRYDLASLSPSLKCPECGHEARREKDLFPFRASRRLAMLGVVVMLMGAGLGYLAWTITNSGGTLPTFILLRTLTATSDAQSESVVTLCQRINTDGLSASSRASILAKLPELQAPAASQLLTSLELKYPSDPAVLAAAQAHNQRLVAKLSGTTAQRQAALASVWTSGCTPLQVLARVEVAATGADPELWSYVYNTTFSAVYQIQNRSTIDQSLGATESPMFAAALISVAVMQNDLLSESSINHAAKLDDPLLAPHVAALRFAMNPSEHKFEAMHGKAYGDVYARILGYAVLRNARNEEQLAKLYDIIERQNHALAPKQREDLFSGIFPGVYAVTPAQRAALHRRYQAWLNVEQDDIVRRQLEYLVSSLADPPGPR